MAGIVVCGAGTCGLVAAMLLADDGHDVVVIERDAAEPPEPAAAWDGWERRGVNQFRLPHFLMSRFRFDMARELPRLVDALLAAGAYDFNFFGPFRDAVPDPDRFDVVTARRPVLDAVVARVAAETPRLDIRRGVALEGVVTGPSARDGIVHVSGVRTTSGEEIAADLVIAATGRRSPLARWLAAAGARPPHEQEEDSGFVYYGRYVRGPNGEQRAPGPRTGDFGSIGILVLPGDDGTIGLGLITASGDAPLRLLRHEGPWKRVLARIPGCEDLVDLEPISEMAAMGGIEDRYRRFVVEGVPVATGVVAVADAWAATNPTLGRGIALGTMHALLLREVVRSHLDRPCELVMAWDDVTETEMTPWYESTVWHDRRKVACYAAGAGLREPLADRDWDRYVALGRAMGTDLDLGVRFVERSGFLLEPPNRLLADEDLVAKLDALVPDNGAHDGPTRAELLELIAG